MTDLETASRGKWSQPGVPHKGWTCEAVDDLGDRRQLCEMCESVQIRYVHYMVHAEWPDVLGCGCVCSGHMSDDAAGAESRERRMQSATRRRQGWLRRKGWRVSKLGNQYIRVDGRCVVVYQGPLGGYAYTLTGGIGDPRRSVRWYETSADAKLAAFDAMVAL